MLAFIRPQFPWMIWNSQWHDLKVSTRNTGFPCNQELGTLPGTRRDPYHTTVQVGTQQVLPRRAKLPAGLVGHGATNFF